MSRSERTGISIYNYTFGKNTGYFGMAKAREMPERRAGEERSERESSQPTAFEPGG